MSTSGFREHGGDGAPRGPWHAPVLSVLVFRATANSNATGSDTAIAGTFQNPNLSPPPPPQAPPPPPPPPNAKGTFACDGPVQTGAGTTATFITNTSKRGGTNSDSSYAHPNNPDNPCGTLNLIFT